jgi:O-antigen ligase
MPIAGEKGEQLMAGETCPRCHHSNGYPIWQTIPKGQGMSFSCRNCGFTWVKRNSFSVGSWFVYGIGVIIGIIIGIFQLLKQLVNSFKSDPGAFIKSHPLLLVIVIAIIVLIIVIFVIKNAKKRKSIDDYEESVEEDDEEDE